MRWILALMPCALFAEAAFLTPADLAGPTTTPVAYAIKREQFTLPSEVPGNPTVVCHIAWPEAADGAKPPRQDDLVYYFQHPKERFYLPPQQSWDWKIYEHLVTDGGFTVCGVFFENMAEEKVDILHDRPASYIYRESKSYTVLRQALDEVRRRRHLPERPAFAFGLSAGGVLAQRFAEAHPDQFDAIASLGGCMFHQGGGSTAAHLLISTLGDVTEEDHRGILRWLDLRGVPAAAWMQTAPDWGKRGQDLFYHCTNRVATSLAMRWLEGVADRRQAGAGPAQAARWPYAADRRDPGHIVDTAQAGWQRLVPEAQAVRLPSAATALAWMSTPYQPAELLPGWRWCRPAAAVKPRGLVVYRWRQLKDRPQPAPIDPTLARMPLQDWDIYQLADLGFVACASAHPDVDLATLRRAAGLADSVPTYLVEQAEALMPSLSAAPVIAARIVIAPAAQATPELGARILGGEGDRYPVRLLVLGDPKQPPQVWPRTTAPKDVQAKALADRARLLMTDDRERLQQALHGMICQRISDLAAELERKPAKP